MFRRSPGCEFAASWLSESHRAVSEPGKGQEARGNVASTEQGRGRRAGVAEAEKPGVAGQLIRQWNQFAVKLSTLCCLSTGR